MKKSFFSSFILTFLLLAALVNAQCDAQKGFFMSYKAMSKRDTMQNLFAQVDTLMPTYNSTYTNEKNTTYTIISLFPQMYYNDHHQKEVYIDVNQVNVTLGLLTLGYDVRFQIKREDETVKGLAKGSTLADDDKFFIKEFALKEGIVEWNAVTIDNLTMLSSLVLKEYPDTITHEDKSTLENMMNDHIGEKNMKGKIMADYNAHYQQKLKEHLNSENIIQAINFSYIWKQLRLNYTSVVRTHAFQNAKEKGLKLQINLELNDHTHNCTPNNMSFDSKYGGLQELISFSTIQNAFIYGLENKLLYSTVGNSWQVPHFQFYMGDLANIFPSASNYLPTDSFYASCDWIGNHKDTQIKIYDVFPHNAIRAQTRVNCTLNHFSKPFVEILFDVTFYVKVVAEESSLFFEIDTAFGSFYEFNPIDEKFSDYNKDLGGSVITQILKGLQGVKTFGTGWKTVKRKFPGATFVSPYLVIFDAGQP